MTNDDDLRSVFSFGICKAVPVNVFTGSPSLDIHKKCSLGVDVGHWDIQLLFLMQKRSPSLFYWQHCPSQKTYFLVSMCSVLDAQWHGKVQFLMDRHNTKRHAHFPRVFFRRGFLLSEASKEWVSTPGGRLMNCSMLIRCVTRQNARIIDGNLWQPGILG